MDGSNVIEGQFVWQDLDDEFTSKEREAPSAPIFDKLVDRQYETYGTLAQPCSEAQELLDQWSEDVGENALSYWQAAVARRQPVTKSKGDAYFDNASDGENEDNSFAASAADVSKINEAEVLGEEHPDMAALLEQDVTFMTGKLYDQGDRRNTQKGGWTEHKPSWGVLLTHPKSPLTNHPVSKSKQGDSIVIGQTVDGQRTANAVKQLDAIVVDIDSGPTIDFVTERLLDLGVFALVHSSFNHLKTSLTLKHDEVVQKMKLDDTPNRLQVLEYLKEHHKDRYDPEFLEQIEVTDFRHHGPNGLQILCTTPPLHKMRIILPLMETAVLSDLGTTSTQWKEVWADIVTGFVVNKLGVSFDSTSCDVNRLFYLPRHPKGTEYVSRLIQGRPVRFNEIETYSKKKYLKDRGDAVPLLAGETSDDDKPPQVETPNGLVLNVWHRRAKDRFMLADLLQAEAEDKVRRVVSDGKVEIECPFEHLHSTEGGTGTVVMDPHVNEYEVWTVSCPHDSCQGRHKFEFLGEMIECDWFDEELLKNGSPYMMEADEPETVEHAESLIGPTGNGLLSQPLVDQNLVYDGWCEEGDVEKVREQLRSNLRERISYVILDGGKAKIFIHKPAGHLPTFWEETALSKTFLNRNIRYQTEEDVNVIKIANEFIFDTERPTYMGTQFEPDTSKAQPEKFNLFNGFPVPPKEGDWSLMRTHVRNNLIAGNGDENHSDDWLFNYFMTWCADLFQNPGRKLGSSIAILGEQGVGKSKFFDWLRTSLGDYSIKVASRRHFIGNFNSHMDSKLLVVAEEAFWSGDKEAAGVLKDLITSDTYNVERKGVDVVERRNYARIAFVTNNEWAIPTDDNADARRFLVLRAGNEKKQDATYFRAIDEQMKNGGLEAMVHEFMTWNPADVGMSFEHLRNAPMTAARAEQATFSANPATEALLQIVEDGFFELPDFERVEFSESESTRVPRTHLTTYLKSRLPLHGGQQKLVKLAVTRLLGDSSWHDNKCAFDRSDKLLRYIEFPPLDELRKTISETYK